MIYLDNAATTPILPEVADEMLAVMQSHFGNPSSVHSAGRQAQQRLLRARQTIADSIGATEDEILFTASGSEGDNMALIQGAMAMKDKGRHIITTAVEHPAVLNTVKRLEQDGFTVTYLPVNENGEITVEQVKEAYRPHETILVSIMYGNNEVGTIYPIAEIGAFLKDKEVLFHTDAVQAYGTETIDVSALNVDLLTVAAHKINGPKGVGFLYIKKGLSLKPLITGGEQESHRRAGTENLPAIVGFEKAVLVLTPEVRQERHQRYESFRTMILEALAEAGVAYEVNGSDHHLPHILNLWLKQVPSDILLMQLDLAGIAISTGSACTAGNVDPSHVLTAMYGEDHPAIQESIRISFGYQNTEEDIRALCDVLVKNALRLQQRRG